MVNLLLQSARVRSVCLCKTPPLNCTELQASRLNSWARLPAVIVSCIHSQVGPFSAP